MSQSQASDAEHPMTNRALAMLRAIGQGRGELTGGRLPDLFVDGLACCDQDTAHRLTRAGLVRGVGASNTGVARRAAELTEAGRAVLGRPLVAAR